MNFGNILEDEITAWFPIGEEGGQILLRYVSQIELNHIMEKAKKTVWVNHQKTAEVDNIKANRLLGRAAVKDWRNLIVNGKPFSYSPENCDLLMDRSWDFASVVNDACTEMKNFIEEQQKNLKKN